MATTGAVNGGHAGETSFDPRNLTGQLFMKGKRENTTLMLIGGMQAIRGVKSKEFDCGQNFEVPDHTVLPERLEGQVGPHGLSLPFQGVPQNPEIKEKSCFCVEKPFQGVPLKLF